MPRICPESCPEGFSASLSLKKYLRGMGHDFFQKKSFLEINFKNKKVYFFKKSCPICPVSVLLLFCFVKSALLLTGHIKRSTLMPRFCQAPIFRGYARSFFVYFFDASTQFVRTLFRVCVDSWESARVLKKREGVAPSACAPGSILKISPVPSHAVRPSELHAVRPPP
jgi:hypothetical protein